MLHTSATLTSLPLAVDWHRVRRRWQDDRFSPARAAVQDRARVAIDDDLRPVREGGGWGHGFFCPDHVVPLEFEPSRPADHRCPTDGRRWRGEDFDGGWVCTLNGRIQSGVQAAAVEWQATGDRSRLEYAKSVLLHYAEIYRDLPPQGRWVGKGKVTGQSLEEAVWAIGIVSSIDRILDQLDDSERSELRTGLLQPLAEHVRSQLLNRVHNIECWHLAGLATLGVMLGDDELINITVDGPTGMHAQLDSGITADGWWVEGSPHYHFYMATAMLQTAAVLRERRPDLAERQDLRSMLMTPLTMIRPDLSLPALNDGWHSISLPAGIGQYAGHYETAHGLWGDPAFGAVVMALEDAGVARSSESALLNGPDPATGSTTDQTRALPVQVKNVHPASGYAILRDQDQDGRVLMLKYGPHGGGHGHPDKLQLDWFAHGERLAPDAGSPAYTSPLQGPWFRQTLSHNTIVVGGESQPPGCGQLLGHQDPDAAGVGVTDAWVTWAADVTPQWGGSWLKEPRSPDAGPYRDVRLRRTVLWHPNYLIDLMQVRGLTDPTRVEWLFHHRGDRQDGPALEQTRAALEPTDESASVYAEGRDESPYQFLDDPHSHRDGSQDWRVTWSVAGVQSRLWAHDPPETLVVEALSPTSPPAESRCTVLRRVAGREVGFVSLLETWSDGEPVVSGFDCTGDLLDGSLVIDVSRGRFKDRWIVEASTDAAPTSVTVTESDAGGHSVRCRLAAEPLVTD